jgi:imidazolonepropionase
VKTTLVFKDAAEVVTCVPSEGNPAGRINGASVAVAGDQILAVGSFAELAESLDMQAAKIIDLQGRVLAPGFVDSHTHVVFGGSRVMEYALKMTHTRADIERMGIPTGITASMSMTRAATREELVAHAADRLERMLRSGTTTVESKSGYGLDLQNELKMLEVNRELDDLLPIDVVSTFLGAHAFPPGISEAQYVEDICLEMLPAVAAENLAEFCDVYIDDGYFNLEQTRKILETAQAMGFKLKIHADQYAPLGGSELAAELGVTSADHLNHTPAVQFAQLAQAGVVGVLMPLIDFAVQHPQPFNARGMLDAGMEIALATDICPGGWTESLQLVIQFACRQYGLSPAEAVLAATVGGARALALNDRGQIAPGLLADLQVWNIPQLEDLIYRLGTNQVGMVLKAGKFVVGSP